MKFLYTFLEQCVAYTIMDLTYKICTFFESILSIKRYQIFKLIDIKNLSKSLSIVACNVKIC